MGEKLPSFGGEGGNPSLLPVLGIPPHHPQLHREGAAPHFFFGGGRGDGPHIPSVPYAPPVSQHGSAGVRHGGPVGR